MKIRALSLAILLSLFCCGTLAQTNGSTTSETSATPDDIGNLFTVMQIHDQMRLVMEQVSKQMKDLSHDQMKKRDPKVSDEEIAKLDAMSDEMLKDIPIDGLLDDMIPIYQKHLSKTDVDAMIAFYSTPTGQKILKEMPALTAEGMQAMQPRLRRLMDEANAKMEKMVADELEKKQNDAVRPKALKN